MIKEILNNLSAILIFILVSGSFFWPYFEGKRIYQSDMVQYQGMSQEIARYETLTGRKPLWTNAMFSGMPTYQISTPDKGNYLFRINKFLRLGRDNQNPVGFLFTGMLSMYILLMILKIDYRLAVLGGIAFGLATNHIILYEAGHLSKLSAITYLPLVIAGIVLIFRGRYWWGFFIFSLGFGLNLSANHVQITYYFFITIPLWLFFQFQYLRKVDGVSTLFRASVILAVGAILAVGSDVCNLWTTYEYSKETIRGNSILTTSADELVDSTLLKSKTGGLDYDYAMEWSNGALDLLACIIPGAAGSSSQAKLFSGSKLLDAYSQQGTILPDKYRAPLYWGSLPFTTGPSYFGIVLFFFFIVGLFIVDGPIKWWTGVSVGLIILLSMGKNFPALNQFVFDHLPLYNRFRTPNSILSIAPVLISPLSFMAVHQLLLKQNLFQYWPLLKKISLRFFSVLLLLALLGPYLFSFSSHQDLHSGISLSDLDNLISDRRNIFLYDTFRSIGILSILYLLLWAHLRNHISTLATILVLALLVIIDSWTVNRRFIDYDSFQEKSKYEHYFDPRPVDLEIAKDEDPNFRVLDWTINTFASASTSFHHNTIGGYHAAKLRRYQDLIDRYLLRGDRGVVNMLNTKYIIQMTSDGLPELFRNEEALGHAWMIDSMLIVPSADREMEVLDSIDLENIAVIHQEYADYLKGWVPGQKGSIQLLDYQPDHLVYTSESDTENLAVFSEIWYGPDKGWQAFLDGKPVDHIRANYLLRAMRIPAGSHRVEFVFKPLSFYQGRIISRISSSLILYGFIWFIGLTIFVKPKTIRKTGSKKKKSGPAKEATEKYPVTDVPEEMIITPSTPLTSPKPISTPATGDSESSGSILTPVFLEKLLKSLSLIILAVLIALSLGSGINADDEFQTDYSAKLVRYYMTLGQDTSALFVDKGKMHLYGGTFEVITGMVNQLLGFEQHDASYHRVRHFFIALLGFLTIWFSSLLAREIGGWRTAILTLVFLFLSPRFLGHAMMNPKDIPFAAGYIISIYFMIRFFQRFPDIHRNDIIGMIMGIGLALGTRAGGLLLIVFLFSFGAIHFFLKFGFRNRNFSIAGKYLKYLIPISAGGYILAILFWPAALIDPLYHPFKALSAFSNLEIYIRLLFEGENILSNQAPANYTLVWLWKTIPLFCITGILGSIALYNTLLRKQSQFVLIVLYISGLFPLLYVLIRHSVLHDGWRHLLFIYPPLVILAAVFWVSLSDHLRDRKGYRYLAYLFVGITCLECGIFIVRNHQYPYVYFNPWSGGLKNAFGNFETDYWGLAMKPAIDWMEDQKILDLPGPDSITIATSFFYNLNHQLPDQFRNKIKVRYLRYSDRYKEDWDYAIYPSRFISGAQLRSGSWPPEETVHSVMAEGIPLVAILKKGEDNIRLGIEALAEKDWSSSIRFLESGLQKYPKNDVAMRGLAVAKMNTAAYDEANQLALKSMEISGPNPDAFLLLGLVNQALKETDAAKNRFFQAIENDPTFYLAYYHLALIYLDEDNNSAALNYALQSLQIRNDFAQSYQLIGQIYERQGEFEKAATYRQKYSALSSSTIIE